MFQNIFRMNVSDQFAITFGDLMLSQRGCFTATTCIWRSAAARKSSASDAYRLEGSRDHWRHSM